MMEPKGVFILIPRTCDYVIFLGKRDLADVIKGDYFGLSWVGLMYSQGPAKRDAGEVSQREGHVIIEDAI